MKLYSIDLKVCATAYIKANTPEEALDIAKKMKGDDFECTEDSAGDDSDFIVGRQYSDPRLPDVSLSPAMTINGPDDDDTPAEVHDYGEEESE